MQKLHILLFAILLIATQRVQAQKTALILSGGGAKGTAHIGVIKALEQYDIGIDYIAGTSIGAIIGGMYAAGYTIEEMEKIVTSSDFQKWASGDIEDQYIYYYKQNRPNASWVSIELEGGKNIKPLLPTNIINPYVMEFQFMEFFAGPSAAASYNFENLYLPFRCIAADIDSNQAIVLKNGQLGSAIRASMTFPFYFKPIIIDGKLLFDGGMYNNFPTDVAIKTWHPEMIIGSKVAGNYSNPDKDNIVSQIQNMLMAKTNYSVILDKGILIEPKTGPVDLVDFSTARAFIDSGYQAALHAMPEILQAISQFESSDKRNAKRTAFKEKIPPYIIDTIDIRGVKTHATEYIRRQFIQKKDSISLAEAKTAYFKLLAEEQIQYIFPEMIYNKNRERYMLRLNVEESKPFEVQFGGSIASNTSNEGFVELRYRKLGHNASQYTINGYFGQFYSSLHTGMRFDFSGKTPFTIAASFTLNYRNYFKNKTYFFLDENPSYLLRQQNNVNLNITSPYTNKGILEAGLDIGYSRDEYYQDNLFTRNDTADKTDFNYISPYLSFDINSLNRKQYASAGARLKITASYISGEEKMTTGSTGYEKAGEKTSTFHHIYMARLSYDNYFEHIGRLKLGFYGEAVVSNFPLRENYTSTLLAAPAFEPFPECQTLFLPGYRAHNYAAAGLKLVYPIIKNLDIRWEGYIFQPYEQIIRESDYTATYGSAFEYRSFMGNTTLVYHTFLGPISLSLNYFDTEPESLSVVFRIGFLLFNRNPWE